jgi:phage terminase large subunit GpA-like protein
MRLVFRNTARSLVAGVFARLLVATKSLTPSQWGAENIVVPDGPLAGQKWDPALTPYLPPILDAMGPDDPCNKGAFKKGTQIGATGALIILIGHTIECDPCRQMAVQPTTESLLEFVRDKLQPTIDGSPALRAKVSRQVSRDEQGSTTKSKRYPGGSLTLTIGNSTAALRSKTVKKIWKDEVDEYPADLGGQGSPHAMIAARRETFLASGDWKEFNASTPTIKGDSYIDAEFERGTKELWHVKCPHCDDGYFPFQWGPNFRFNEKPPYNAHYIAPCCGCEIESYQRDALVREAVRQGGGFRATVENPELRPHRSWHINALTSPFVPWDIIAERYNEAKDDPAKLKSFTNLTLGEAYDVKGDAPDHEHLFARREAFARNRIPARGLILTAGADVQKAGIYYEVIAWAPNGESWVVDADFIDGATNDHSAGAFLKLAEIYDREYADAFGGRRKVDAFGVDSGWRSTVVYQWCRQRVRAYALKGIDGWERPALGTGTPTEYFLDGRKVEGGVKVWPVGTWSLKGLWYENLWLALDPKTGLPPKHFAHFPSWLSDDAYFRHITSEYLADVKMKGRTGKRWTPRPGYENHWLDCRIYNMALADHLGLHRMTTEEWLSLAKVRAAPLADTGDLFAPAPLAVQLQANDHDIRPSADTPQPETQAPPPVASEVSTTTEAPAAADGGWLGRSTEGWLNR